MQKLNYKKGFTLVECVVAMAVLAIMSLLLVMILNVSILAKNENVRLEAELDHQVENLVKDETENEKAYGNNIEFKKSGDSANKFSIPGNDTNGVSANKVVEKVAAGEDKSDISIGKIDYNFDNYFSLLPAPEEIDDSKTPDPTGDKAKTGGQAGEDNVISTVDFSSGGVKITQNTADKEDVDDNTYRITLTLDWSVSSYSPEKAIRIILPIGAKYEKALDETNCIVTNSSLSPYVVRCQSCNGYAGSGDVPGISASPVTSRAKFSFTISKTAYDNYYKYLSAYFENGSDSSKTTTGNLS